MKFLLLLPLFSGATGLSIVDCGACSLAKLTPKDNKDAYFMAPPNHFGVFDGVSQGPESRVFAQTLASEADAYLSSGAGGVWDTQAPAALLRGTTKAASVSGMSTALLLKMDLEAQTVCTYNLGDCCCLVVRGGSEVGDITAVTYHDNGAPFQLAGGDWISDDVEDGTAETFNVRSGDVVLCFSDGVTGNLALNDIAKVVGGCAGQPAETIAQTVAERARDAELIADDITVLAVRLGGEDGETAVAPPPAAQDGEGIKGAIGNFFQKAADAAAEQAKAAAASAAESAKEAAAAAAKAAADKAKNAMGKRD